MSEVKEQTKFVSNIPKNNLEPVYLGGSPVNKDSTKTNGIYVPGFLKGETETPKQVVPKKTDTDFPSLSSVVVGKPKWNVVSNNIPIQSQNIIVEQQPVSKTFLNYANAAKKPVVAQTTEPPKETKFKSVATQKVPLDKKIETEYSDSDDSEDNSGAYEYYDYKS